MRNVEPYVVFDAQVGLNPNYTCSQYSMCT